MGRASKGGEGRAEEDTGGGIANARSMARETYVVSREANRWPGGYNVACKGKGKGSRWAAMKHKTIETVAALAVWLSLCVLFAVTALGFVGYFD
jgi:hypothetical protein